MTVYIAELSIPYEGSMHIGVYSTLEKAQRGCRYYSQASGDSDKISWKENPKYFWGEFNYADGTPSYTSYHIRICEVE